MYHGISDTLEGKHPYFETNTAPRLFAEQMRFLHENGYRTTDLAKALETIKAGIQVERQVVITFDDGYRNFYTHAFAVLMRYGFSATVFVVTDITGEQRVCEEGKEYMTWGEMREVQAHGIHIGSHTVTHPKLQTMAPAQVKYEIERSKEIIEDKLGVPLQSFSYPYAFPELDKRVVALVREALESSGYQNGVSTIIGTAGRQHDKFFLPRLPVNSYDDLRFFRAKLEGGYDWLHTPQRLYKNLRSRNGSVARLAGASSY
ncbi:MAG: polysaccharide deacetylase family protein [Terriglobales bacterium]|jgi:peptidoglycan/xylan/chitin deacetylase (PgdA/CDA1 family)